MQVRKDFRDYKAANQALESKPGPFTARMELHKPVFHQRLNTVSPLYRTWVKVGVNVGHFTVRTRTMAALYAVTGREDPLSLQEWCLTGTCLFDLTPPTFLSAETENERLWKQLDEGSHNMQCCAKHTRGAWLVEHNAVQAVCQQAGEEARVTARVDVAQGLPREFHTTGSTHGDLALISSNTSMHGNMRLWVGVP